MSELTGHCLTKLFVRVSSSASSGALVETAMLFEALIVFENEVIGCNDLSLYLLKKV